MWSLRSSIQSDCLQHFMAPRHPSLVVGTNQSQILGMHAHLAHYVSWRIKFGNLVSFLFNIFCQVPLPSLSDSG